MKELTVEISDKYVPDQKALVLADGSGAMMITPAIDEDYWIFRVRLYEDQAIVGFPKFTTIGIGFVQEEDWNTNFPYTCPAEQIYDHIKHNKRHKQITDEECVEAIRLVQQAAQRYVASLPKPQTT